MTKILIIPSWYPTAENPNAGIFFKEQANALLDHGLDISIYFSNCNYKNQYRNIFSRPLLKDLSQDNLKTYFVNGFCWPKFNKTFIKNWAKRHFKSFEQYLKIEGKPDLLHAHSFIAGYLTMELSKKYNIPYIITEHHIEFLKSKPKSRYLKFAVPVFDNAQKVVGVSPALTHSLQLITKTECVYIPNIVDETIFSPSLNNRQFNNKINLLTIANLEPYKNIPLLLESFSLIVKRHPNLEIVLRVIGDGSQKKTLKTLANKLKINDKIIWENWLDRPYIAKALQNADLFLLTSLWESFGVVLIESIASGTPVLCTAEGGPKDIINNNNGKYFPHINANELSTQILEIIQNKKQYNATKMSNEIFSKYGSKIIAKKLTSLYQSIIFHHDI